MKKDGYAIEAEKNRGYLLKEDASRVFGRTEIESRIHTKWIGRSLYYYDAIDSTNLQAKRLAEEGAPDGTVVVADQQSAGRGRRGRTWASPAGANLYFTVLLRPKIAPDKASMLTLVMALAVAEGIRSIAAPGDSAVAGRMAESGRTADSERTAAVERTADSGKAPSKLEDGNFPVGIKWPNDIVIDGRKACGILTEMSLSAEQGSIDHLVIGVGINVAKQEFPAELQGHAVALEEFTLKVNRSELLNAILQYFEGFYDLFCAQGDLSGLKKSYDALLINRDRQVRVLDPKGEYDGMARGIRPTGELIVELPDGELRVVYAGAVSVRGIYGYV